MGLGQGGYDGADPPPREDQSSLLWSLGPTVALLTRSADPAVGARDPIRLVLRSRRHRWAEGMAAGVVLCLADNDREARRRPCPLSSACSAAVKRSSRVPGRSARRPAEPRCGSSSAVPRRAVRHQPIDDGRLRPNPQRRRALQDEPARIAARLRPEVSWGQRRNLQVPAFENTIDVETRMPAAPTRAVASGRALSSGRCGRWRIHPTASLSVGPLGRSDPP